MATATYLSLSGVACGIFTLFIRTTLNEDANVIKSASCCSDLNLKVTIFVALAVEVVNVSEARCNTQERLMPLG